MELGGGKAPLKKGNFKLSSSDHKFEAKYEIQGASLVTSKEIYSPEAWRAF